MKSIIIIPSRMASTRFPGKPMMKIDGIPMIQRVWELAIESNIGDVYVACSEKNVYDLIISIGGIPILTNPDLPSGTDRIYSALKQLKNISEIECVINLQGDMPLINPNVIRKVIEPIQKNYDVGTLVTTLKEDELNNPNITKAVVDWKNDEIGEAIEFYRLKNQTNKKAYHHVGIYSYSLDSLEKFVNLPKSKNEMSLNLEQYRAMDAGMNIGVTYEKEIPPSVDTKEDLINIESIIRTNNDKY